MITRIVTEKRELFAGGHEFAVTGAYERIVGRAYGEINPRTSFNKNIVNIEKAPRNARGCVEYWTDFFVLKPLDIQRGNGKIFFDAPNRGSKRVLMFLNDAPEENDPRTLDHVGNGFLMREGYSILWCGWQGDLVEGDDILRAQVPVATNDGRAITGAVRAEIVVEQEGVFSSPLSGDERTVSYEAVTTDSSRAALTVRKNSYGLRAPVPPSEWKFAVWTKDPQSGRVEAKSSAKDLYLRGGFKPGWIYELVYTAKDPLVLGVGFAAVRDVVSFFRYDTHDRSGRANPLLADNGAGIKGAYGWGRSQSGRFLRDFVYQGFNEDEGGRRVFDAIAPHAAGGGRLFLNYEFARPNNSSQQHTDQLDPEIFPCAYTVIRDPQTGRRDGILKRPKSDPYVMHTNTSTEYWQKRAALAHTDGRGKDIRIPPKVRIYLIAGAQHNAPLGSVPKRARTQNLTNPMPVGDVLRALTVAMDRWVSAAIAPPPSRIPTVRNGTLVRPHRRYTRFPKIPGVRFTALHNRQLFLDYGRDIAHGKIDVQPPRWVKRGSYVILVPKVDEDGNDVAGIRLPAVQVPLGTYTGWNLQDGSKVEGELAGLLGSFIPFCRAMRERKSAGDPRLSLDERYRGPEDYRSKVAIAARRLIEGRFLLPEDAARIIREAQSHDDSHALSRGLEDRGGVSEKKPKTARP